MLAIKISDIFGTIPNKETVFRQTPKTTFGIYFDSIERRGADKINLITDHSVTIELYSYAPDHASEALIETNLDNIPVSYKKQERTWIETEQLYQVIYEFEYTEK